MKKSIIFFVFMALSLLISGCSKMTMEGIFEGEYDDVALPVDIKSTCGEEIFDFLSDPEVLKSILGDGVKGKDFAVILNDINQFEGVKLTNEEQIFWRDFDFSNYSIVLVSCWFQDSSGYIEDSRVIENGDDINLYVKVSRSTEGVAFQTPTRMLSSAVYKKLPSVNPKIIRWDNE